MANKLKNLFKKILFFLFIIFILPLLLNILPFYKEKIVENNAEISEEIYLWTGKYNTIKWIEKEGYCLLKYQRSKIIKDTCKKAKKLYDTSSKGYLLIVKDLVESGVPVNLSCQQDCKGWTAIMIASAEGQLDVVNYLIKNSADVNLQNDSGRTALHFAVRYDFYEITELLLKAGANPDIKDFEMNNKTSVSSPMQDALTQKNDTVMLKLLIKYGGDVNTEFWGFTPLIQAISFNDIELVKILMEKNANPFTEKVVDEVVYTPLSIAEEKSEKMKALVKEYIKNYKE